MKTPAHLVELLRARAAEHPDRSAYVFLADGERQAASLTFGELDREARTLAAVLQAGRAAGERVLLLYPSGVEFVAAFVSCLYAGAIAVPAYPPRRNRNLRRLQAIAADAQPAIVLTTAALLPEIRSQLEPLWGRQRPRWIATPIPDHDGEPDRGHGRAADWHEPALDGETLAFLQYTSGSTATPKGVMVSHANLLYNERMIQLAYGHSAATVFAGWLPLHHDMGLIGNVLQPLFLGVPSILMSPAAFLQQPWRWLAAISRYRATTSGGPDFAYRLCIQRIPPAERARLDLSSWNVAFNGAEPVRAETLDEFAAAFAVSGFRREAFCPCYGLAEATLLASGGARDALPTVYTVSGEALGRHRALAATAADPEAKRLVGCGTTWLEQQIVIADPESLRRCPPDRIGEIWLAGRNVARGYWQQPGETERAFGARLAETGEGPFLRTGDLGFLKDGELFVTGRLKDLIILRGVNHYPDDIERTAEASHPGLSQGSSAAFSVDLGGEERLVVAQELRRDHRRPDVEEVARAIRRAVSEAHEAQVHTVVLLPPGGLAKTSSGKIERRANRAAFLAGNLAEVGRSVVDLAPALTAAGDPEGEAPAGEDGLLRRALRRLRSAPERRALLTVFLEEQTARALRLSAASIEAGARLSDLGLDSLQAVELQHRLETALGVTLPAAALLDGPALDELAAELLERFDDPSAGHPPAGPLPRPPPPAENEAGRRQPLSHGQRALWVLHQREPESPAYNVAAAFVVEGPLDREALRLAVRQLVDRHPALRTSFATAAGESWQRVLPRVAAPVEQEEVAGGDEAALERRLAKEARRLFDLGRAPLLRVRLFDVTGGRPVLLLVMHHLVTDLWSLEIFLTELGELYDAARSGRQARLPPLTMQYADHVRGEAERLAGSEGERLWAFWRERLAGELPLLDLRTDRPRPAIQTSRGATFSRALAGAPGDRLQALARVHGATRFMTLLAAFQALLGRYTGQTDLLVGTPVAGRGRAGLAGVIGYFVNLVAMRGDLRGDPSFNALLACTRQRALAAFENQDFPFALLVERLQPDRDPGRSPVCQVLFALQQARLGAEQDLAAMALGDRRARLGVGGLDLRLLPIEEQAAQFDLRLWAAAAPGGDLLTSWQYRSDLFDPPTIARLAGHFETLLHGIAADPERPLSELPLLTAGERLELTAPPAERSDTASAACLHQLFEQQAECAPDAIAVGYGDRCLSYAELNRRANRLAHHLIMLGVGPEVRTGLSLDPGCELVSAILAILKAGGCYVPLDPANPPERLGFMLEDAQAEVLVTESRLLDRQLEGGLPPPRARLVLLDRPDAAAAPSAPHGSSDPRPRAVPDNAAYVIFTSGSTGRPKGVVVAHRQVIRLFAATRRWYGFGPGDVFTMTHSFAFDVSVWEIWGALLHGGRLAMVPYWLVRSPEALLELLERERVTVLSQTPSAFRPLLQADQARPAAVDLALRWIVFAGEALELRGLRPWFQRHGDRAPTLVNMYGITETTVHSTFRPLSRADGERPESVVGVAIPDLQLLVLERGGQPAPAGVAGELYVGGAGLARGYLAQPALTAERFLPNPFAAAPGERLYRSGDLVRRTADGDLEYLGRADQQIKIRGFRVEAGEIESALGEHPAVAAAVVAAGRDAAGGQRLVAYVVGRRARPAAGELREHLRSRLPSYMLPAVFVFLDELPLTPTGKVNRRALPAPAAARPERERVPIAPRDRCEAQLAEIWRELLGLEEEEAVGVTDNFFDLGGDSILAIQVVARARQLGYRLTPRQSFEHPTIAELASLATAAAAGADREESRLELEAAGAQGEGEGAWRLTPLQHGMLFHRLSAPDRDPYLVQVLCTLDGPLDTATFDGAWRLAAARHPVLRTSFRWQGLDEPVQVVHATARPPWSHHDWRPLGAALQERRLADLLAADRSQGFDLAAAPLLRLALLRVADGRHLLLVSFHHLILDGWSAAALLKEILTAYAACRAGREPGLPPAAPFQDYLAWLAGQDQGSAESFWRRRLRGFEAPTPLPADRPAVAASGPPSHDDRRLALPPAATAALGAFTRRHRLTQSTLVLGAWALLLARHAGEPDVVFGSTFSGRPAELPGVETMLGLLINTLPVRVAMEPGRPLAAWLASLQAELVETRQHEHSALAAVQAWSEVPRGQALFESLVVFENYPLDRSLLGRRGELSLAGVRAVERTHYPLSLTALPGDSLALEIAYDRRRFDAATALRLLAQIERFLTGLEAPGEACGETAGRRLGEASLLGSAEQHQLLREWNDSRAAGAAEAAPIHERFAAIAASRGDGTAVEEPGDGGPGRHLSYGELDRRANRLAWRLRALGAGPEALVGVCVGRRLEMVETWLAVLKAGGGFVALDPAYPAARLAFLLADAQISVLVAEPRLAANLPDCPARIVLVGADGAGGDGDGGPCEAPPPCGVVPLNVSHVIYTSGSTGLPKAVVLPHQALSRYAATAARIYGLGPADRVLQFHSISFDAAIEELCCCFTVGAALVLRSDAMQAGAAAFLAECERLGVTFLDLPTAFWHQLSAGLSADLVPPASLRSVVFGGERTAPERLAGWLRHAAPDLRLTVSYGPTECTVGQTVLSPRAGDAVRREVPIGRPLANLRLHVLDGELRPVPIGGLGEVAIGGDGVTRGYLRRPELTASRFVPDPFGELPGERLYRTGDLARRLPCGELELAGRADRQVKVRGFRVELGEIESALLRHPSIEQAVVEPWAGALGHQRLVAYVVTVPGAPPPAAGELRQFLAQQLPAHMVPQIVQPLAALPLTASGSKVDRRALPPPDDLRSALETAYVSPAGEIEARLAEIWSRLLGVERVGRDDNFFALGGDSILSLQVSARAHQAGLRFTPKQLFERQTLAELAAVTEVARAAMAPAPEQEPVTGEMPLTPIQEWFFSQRLPRPEHWNQALLLTLAPASGRPALVPGSEGLVAAGAALAPGSAALGGPRLFAAAIAALVRHHDALRFSFPEPPAGGRRRAVAAATAPVPCAWCDLNRLAEVDRGRAMTAAAAAAQASLRLTGPLLRAIYFDLGAERPARLLLAIHHLVVDGVSWRLLLEDLGTLWRQLRQGAAPRLPPKTSSFKQWAERLVEHAGSPAPALAPEVDLWLAWAEPRGAGLPLDFPLDRTAANHESDLAVVRTALDAEATRALLQEVPQVYGTGINDALLAALLRTLARWTGSPALLVELEGHGREPLFDDLDLSRTVGWFTTTFPVLLQLPPEDDPGAALKAVKERLRAVPGHGIGYGLLRYLHPDPEVRRQLARLPRPEVAFNYLGQLDPTLGGGSPLALAPEPCGRTRDPRGARTHLLEIEGRIIGGRLEIEWQFSRRLHREATMARLAQGYLGELLALVEHCRGRDRRGYTPSDFPQMSFGQQELDALVEDLADTLEGGA